MGDGGRARQARRVVPVSMGHSTVEQDRRHEPACLIRADPRPNKYVAK